jgi:PAS domain S-box-containing protein
MIAAMTAAAIASAGASWRAVLAFNIPALAPLAATYAVASGEFGPPIAFIVLLYAVATAYLAWTTQQMVMRSIRLRSRNDRLLQALRKQVDAAHEAEKRFRALVEASQDVTLIFSPEGRVVYASPAVATALGAPPRMIIGKTTKELVHPDDLPLFRAVGEKALSNLGEVIPLPHVCLKGEHGKYVALCGRLTNMLYVPGVEGFVFNGGRLESREREHLHAVAG